MHIVAHDRNDGSGLQDVSADLPPELSLIVNEGRDFRGGCSDQEQKEGMSVALLADMMTGAICTLRDVDITSSLSEYLKEILILGKNNN